eukprot:4962637-Prymnesium_polylepis.1
MTTVGKPRGWAPRAPPPRQRAAAFGARAGTHWAPTPLRCAACVPRTTADTRDTLSGAASRDTRPDSGESVWAM